MTYCEFEGFIEDWVQGLPMDFCLKFLLVVREEVDADVGVRKSIQVHWGEILMMKPMTMMMSTVMAGRRAMMMMRM